MITTTELRYQDGDTVCVGYLALPTDAKHLPAVMVAPAWEGRDGFACEKARAWAECGYVGFAIDIYGGARLGNGADENRKLMQPFLDDRAMLRQRLVSAWRALRAHDAVDDDRIVATGYCFGGLCALDLARSGTPIRGAISNHGLLFPPAELPNEKIHARILVLHGHEDPLVPPEQVRGFQDEMTQAGVDWNIHVYGRTSHSFTDPKADNSIQGLIYSESADRRAWRAANDFVAECI
jgi:dienelactone hydrolase